MHMIGFWALLSLLMLSGCEHEFALSEQVGKEEVFLIKNRHKAQRKAKFYINKCRSASCMQGGLKQASA